MSDSYEWCHNCGYQSFGTYIDDEDGTEDTGCGWCGIEHNVPAEPLGGAVRLVQAIPIR